MCSPLNVVNAIWSETLGGGAMQNVYIVYTMYSVQLYSVQCTLCTVYIVQCRAEWKAGGRRILGRLGSLLGWMQHDTAGSAWRADDHQDSDPRWLCW